MKSFSSPAQGFLFLFFPICKTGGGGGEYTYLTGVLRDLSRKVFDKLCKMRKTLICAFTRIFIEKKLFVPGIVLGAGKALASKTLPLSSGTSELRKEEISIYEIMIIIILIILVIKFPGMDESFCMAGTFGNITDKTGQKRRT